MVEFYIPFRLPGFNEAHNDARTHWSKAAETKRNATESVGWLCKRLQPIHGKVNVTILWGMKGDNRDPDNVYSGVKYILDGLVSMGILESDTKRHIGSIHADHDDGSDITVVRLEEAKESA